MNNKIYNCLDIIEKMFYGNYENIRIVDIDSRRAYNADTLSVSSLKDRTLDKLDRIIAKNNIIYIKFDY